MRILKGNRTKERGVTYMGLTSELANDLYKIYKLQKEDTEQIKIILIDYFAAACAGYKLNREFNRKIESLICRQDSAQESYVFLHNRKYPAEMAAFMNAVYCHGAELDDGNKKAAGHVATHIIPAVFALADKLGSSNNDVMIAIATGYEAYIRISAAAQPGLVKRGFHSTGMAGTLACAAACARLYHLDASGIENAVALATTMTGGLLSYGDSRPEIKPLNPGKAAENGLFSSMLANEGIQGPSESLEGPHGWFHAVTDEIHEGFLKGTNRLLLHECYFKLYPSCRHTHCCIDSAIRLHHVVAMNEISKINVYIYPSAIELAGVKIPKNRDETKFSIPYTLARALSNGKYGIEDMDLTGLTSTIKNIINKINLISDQTMENREKGIRGAKVEILLNNGDKKETTTFVPKGDPENPLCKEDIINKLFLCAENIVDKKSLAKLVQKINQIEENERFQNPMSELALALNFVNL